MRMVEFAYYARKAYALYPGIVTPRSAPVFARHYASRRAARSWLAAATDAFAGLLFHAWIPLRARVIQRRFGRDAAWRRRAIAIARTRFADPADVALFRIEDASEFDHYIRRFEDAAFNKIINPGGWSRRCVLADKRRFYARCAAAGLAHPAVHAIVEGGHLRGFRPAMGAPLLVKPSHGEGGRGVARLPAALSSIEDESAFLAALRPHLRGSEDAWVVQRALSNHGALGDYAMDALITARLSTMLDEQGCPELVSTVLRMASRRGPVIDNMKAGGLIMPIDMASGSVGIACRGYGGGDVTHHPVSGAPLTGLVLPDWPAACALVADAHARAFGEYALIGWDVAFTPEGPVLVEGNAKPGVLMPQRSSRRGLAGQRYGELLAWHLARGAAGNRSGGVDGDGCGNRRTPQVRS